MAELRKNPFRDSKPWATYNNKGRDRVGGDRCAMRLCAACSAKLPSSIRQIAKTWQKRYSRSRVPPAAQSSRCAVPTPSARSLRARSAAAWCRSCPRMAGDLLNPARLPKCRRTPIRFRRRATRRFRRAATCHLAVRLLANRQPFGPRWLAGHNPAQGARRAALGRLARPIGGQTESSRLLPTVNPLHHPLRHPRPAPCRPRRRTAGNGVGRRRPLHQPQPVARQVPRG